jgi:hypothetical protein
VAAIGGHPPQPLVQTEAGPPPLLCRKRRRRTGVGRHMRPGGHVEAAEGVEADHRETTLEVVCRREGVYFEARTGAGRKDHENM